MCKGSTDKPDNSRRWQVDVKGESIGNRYTTIEEPEVGGRSKSYLRLIVPDGVYGQRVVFIPLGQYKVEWFELPPQKTVAVPSPGVVVGLDLNREALIRDTRNAIRKHEIVRINENIRVLRETIERLKLEME